MFIPMYIEVDDQKTPVYIEQCYSRICRNQIVITTNEYACRIDQKSNMLVIPEEIISEIDAYIESPDSRGALLCIKRIPSLEEWLQELCKAEDGKIDGLLTKGNYVSTNLAARNSGVLCYVEAFEKETEANYSEKIIYELRRQLRDAEDARENLIEYSKSMENYVKELEMHASKLDKEIQEYKQMSLDEEDNLNTIKELTRKNKEYLRLYKSAVEENGNLKMMMEQKCK